MSICIEDIVPSRIPSNQVPSSAKHHQRKARKEMITTTSYENDCFQKDYISSIMSFCFNNNVSMDGQIIFFVCACVCVRACMCVCVLQGSDKLPSPLQSTRKH